MGFGSAEGILDGVDTFVAETGDFDVGADFGGLGCEALGDVGLYFVFDDVVGERDRIPYIRVTGS